MRQATMLVSPNTIKIGTEIYEGHGKFSTVKSIERPCDRTHVHAKMSNGATYCYDMAGTAEIKTSKGDD